MAKIVNETEVRRWYEEGRTYAWMADEHLRKYDVQVAPSAFSQMRHRRGWDRRNVRDDDLIPWAVRPEHRWSNAAAMLRYEARRRAGKPLTPAAQEKLSSWLAGLAEANAVVHYEPDTDQGWFYVPREVYDEDIIRKPPTKTTERRSVD